MQFNFISKVDAQTGPSELPRGLTAPKGKDAKGPSLLEIALLAVNARTQQQLKKNIICLEKIHLEKKPPPQLGWGARD